MFSPLLKRRPLVYFIRISYATHTPPGHPHAEAVNWSGGVSKKRAFQFAIFRPQWKKKAVKFQMGSVFYSCKTSTLKRKKKGREFPHKFISRSSFFFFPSVRETVAEICNPESANCCCCCCSPKWAQFEIRLPPTNDLRKNSNNNQKNI